MSTIDEKKCIQMSDFDCVYCGLIFQSTAELAEHQTKVSFPLIINNQIYSSFSINQNGHSSVPFAIACSKSTARPSSTALPFTRRRLCQRQRPSRSGRVFRTKPFVTVTCSDPI